MTAEKDIEQKLVKMIRAHGGLCLKWVCPGNSGVPDRIVILPGKQVFFVETKKPAGGRLSKVQLWWLRHLCSFGFYAVVVWNDDDLQNLERMIAEKVIE